MAYIYNNNNNIYKVVEKSGAYMLLQNIKENVTPFVVAYGYDEMNYSWSSGKYYAKFEEAEKEFRKSVGR